MADQDLGSGMKWWAVCNDRLRAAQLGQGNSQVTGEAYTPDMLDADLLAEAKGIDSHRSDWEWALKSPLQEDMDSLRVSAVQMYQDWIDAGRQPVK